MNKRIEALKVLADQKMRPRRRGRKQRETPPPSLWWRSVNGTPFRIRKTSKVNDADEWLYRCDFGNIVGNQLWSWHDLERDGCRPLKKQPRDWELAEWRSS